MILCIESFNFLTNKISITPYSPKSKNTPNYEFIELIVER